MIELFATATRGLEELCAAEMAEIAGLRVTAAGYRRVSAEFAGEPQVLLDLSTVDDVFVLLAEWAEVVPQRAALAQIAEWSARLNFAAALETVRAARGAPARPGFSVTVNFVGKRNYSSDEVKAAVAGAVSARTGWCYGEENETGLNLRVFIEHERAWLGLRLSAFPQHSRVYKQAHLSGSLKPPVAAAMLRLTQPWAGGLVLDPFCGAGTLPIEAARAGLQGLGGDLDPAALAAARENAGLAGAVIAWSRWDGRALPLAERSVDFVATNAPWGRQVRVDEPLAELYRRACAEIERVLIPQGRAVLLTSLPELVSFRRLRPIQRLEISLYGQTPSILVYSF